MGNSGNHYDAEFKTDAVRLVKEGGRSVASIAKDLWFNPQTLRNQLGDDKKRASSDKVRIMELEAELGKAVRRHKPARGTIHHSDLIEACNCSKECKATLNKYGMICSMSRKGNYYDNACAETFFSTIKYALP